MSDLDPIERLCEQVADREAIDWLLAESRAKTPDDLVQIELLKLLDSVALVHGTLQSEPLPDDEARAAAAAPEPAGDDVLTSWGRYQLEEAIGRGGFGTVYRGWDRELQMPVALKILHRRFDQAELRERLLREGRALAQVKHPNVVRVLNVEQNEGRLGLVMEFLRGSTLDAIVAADGAYNDRDAANIGQDVCRALAAVHATKVIHRDVKARNILRERGDHAGRVVLMDFGAGLTDDEAGGEGGAMGTPLYMAPELLRDEPASVASDIYAVGVLLFFLVTRRHPYEGATVDEIRRAQAEGRRRSLTGSNPELSAPFVKVVERALAPDPRERFTSASAMLQALVAIPAPEPIWRVWLRRVALFAPTAGVVLTLGGILSCAAFNQTLDRGEFADESFGFWFRKGLQAMVMPLLVAVLAWGAFALLLCGRSLLVAMSAGARALDEAMALRCRAIGSRMLMRDLRFCSYWLMLATALVIVAMGWFWAPLYGAVAAYAATAPAETLALLSSTQNYAYQLWLPAAIALVASANLAGWFALSRAARSRGIKLPWWLAPTEVAICVLLYGSLQLPYRVLNDSDELEVVQVAAGKCFVLGYRGDVARLFCPAAPQRMQDVPAEGLPTERLPYENPFEIFAAAVHDR